jgi:WD40 repeat protein
LIPVPWRTLAIAIYVNGAKLAEVRIRARRLRQELLSKPRAVLRGHTAEVESIAFAPDGKILASGGKDGTLRLWDLASGKETARLGQADKTAPRS